MQALKKKRTFLLLYILSTHAEVLTNIRSYPAINPNIQLLLMFSNSSLVPNYLL